MLIPNNPEIDFDALNERINARIEQEPVTLGAVPLHQLMALEDLAFVEQAYANFLRRQPSPAEAQNMLSTLQRGESKYALLATLLLTPEFIRSGQPVLSRRLRLHRAIHRFGPVRKVVGLAFAILRLPQLEKRINALQNLLHRQQMEYRSSLANLEADYLNAQDQITSLDSQLQTLKAEAEQLRGSLEQLDQAHTATQKLTQSNNSRVKALELTSQEARPLPTSRAPESAETRSDESFDAGFYLAFEDRFRGAPEVIRDRLRAYLPLLHKHPLLSRPEHRIVDLGCGRGEWLQLLKEAGFSAEGIEMSPVNTALCQEHELKVTTADALLWLGRQPNESLSCISSFHMIEHLPFPQFRTLMEQCWRVLQPGGLLILETPNPENLVTGTTHFYTDPTHLRPIPPGLTEFLAEYAGFTQCEIKRLHPIPESLQIHEDSEVARRCNQLFYSAQDYALIAFKPADYDHAH